MKKKLVDLLDLALIRVTYDSFIKSLQDMHPELASKKN